MNAPALVLPSSVPPRWPHQELTFQKGLSLETLFDTSDPGTGKTRAHIDIFQQRLKAGESSKLLVVCPMSLMAPAWQADIRRFAPDLRVSLAYADVRAAAFDTPADVYVINTDGVKWLASQTDRWMKRQFGESASLVVDESTAFKHHTSKRSCAMKSLVKHFKFRALLTGTPITISITDIWHQLYLLDDGQRLGKSFVKFRNSVQTPVPAGGFVRWVDKAGTEDVISFMINDITVRHQFEEVMTIPENHSRTLSFDLPPKILKIYKDLAENAYLELEKGDVNALNAAVLSNKLLQVASGAVYDSMRKTLPIDSTRYELVMDLLEEREHSLVFFNWGHQAEALTQRAKKRGFSYELLDGTVPHRERTAMVEKFQQGNLRVLFLHPQTGAHGLTLTKGRTTIWASPRYEPDFLKQGIHRIYRGGQTEQTENIMVCANDTIEGAVYERLNNRYGRMVNLLDLLKVTHARHNDDSGDARPCAACG